MPEKVGASLPADAGPRVRSSVLGERLQAFGGDEILPPDDVSVADVEMTVGFLREEIVLELEHVPN